MAQFRVEFVLDQATGKYLAELYNPENQQELLVRTEALYPSQAAAVLGLVQLFKDAILQFPPPDKRAHAAEAKAPARGPDQEEGPEKSRPEEDETQDAQVIESEEDS